MQIGNTICTDYSYGGQYKTDDNVILEIDSQGNKKVRFAPVPLSLLLLYKSGFDVGKYISFEEQINKNKGWYYQSLKESSEEWHESKNNYFPFMQNFLSTLYVCYQELDKRFAVVNSNKITKTSRIESTVLNSLLPISKAEICKLLPDISPTTVEAVLGKMVKSGIITTIGNGRATKYLRK